LAKPPDSLPSLMGAKPQLGEVIWRISGGFREDCGCSGKRVV